MEDEREDSRREHISCFLPRDALRRSPVILPQERNEVECADPQTTSGKVTPPQPVSPGEKNRS